MPAVEEGTTNQRRLAPARAHLALLGPHPVFCWIALGYGVGLRGVSSTPLLMLVYLYYTAADVVKWR